MTVPTLEYVAGAALLTRVRALVWIAVTVFVSDGEVVVRDHGPGIPPADAERRAHQVEGDTLGCGDLGERHPEQVVQHPAGALGRCQRLEHDQQRPGEDSHDAPLGLGNDLRRRVHVRRARL